MSSWGAGWGHSREDEASGWWESGCYSKFVHCALCPARSWITSSQPSRLLSLARFPEAALRPGEVTQKCRIPQVLASRLQVWGHPLPSQSWGPVAQAHPIRDPPGTRKKDQGILRATRKASRLLARPVTPPALHWARPVTLSSPGCYLKVPPGALAVGLGLWEQRGRDWSPGMCPMWGLGEGADPLRPQFPHLSMTALGSESVRFTGLLSGSRAQGGSQWGLGVSVNDEQGWV